MMGAFVMAVTVLEYMFLAMVMVSLEVWVVFALVDLWRKRRGARPIAKMSLTEVWEEIKNDINK